MMSTKRFLRYVVFGLIAISSFCGHGNALLLAKAPEVTISKLEFVNWLDEELTLNITFSVDNPNNIDAQINAIRYELFAMGRSISKDYRDVSAFIRANEVSSLTMPISIDTVQLLSAVPQVILSNQLEYRVKGAVVLEGVVIHIPFNKEGVFSLLAQ